MNWSRSKYSNHLALFTSSVSCNENLFTSKRLQAFFLERFPHRGAEDVCISRLHDGIRNTQIVYKRYLELPWACVKICRTILWQNFDRRMGTCFCSLLDGRDGVHSILKAICNWPSDDLLHNASLLEQNSQVSECNAFQVMTTDLPEDTWSITCHLNFIYLVPTTFVWDFFRNLYQYATAFVWRHSRIRNLRCLSLGVQKKIVRLQGCLKSHRKEQVSQARTLHLHCFMSEILLCQEMISWLDCCEYL